MDELSFNSELAKFKVVRRYDYIKTPLKERRHPAAAAKTAQHRAAVTTASQAPLLPSRAAPAACTRDQDFWDFIREQMDGQLNAAQKETFLGFLKEVNCLSI